jgi:CheY-like chemotaxis protein
VPDARSGNTAVSYTTVGLAGPEPTGGDNVSKPDDKERKTILLVEDEAPVREMAARALTQAGYDVLAAEDGAAALRVVGERRGRVDLVVTDVMMPVIGGIELAERLAASCPGAQVVYVSGLPWGDVSDGRALPEGHVFLRKPYLPDALVHAVRGLLEG